MKTKRSHLAQMVVKILWQGLHKRLQRTATTVQQNMLLLEKHTISMDTSAITFKKLACFKALF
jgi:hypothetical protein